MFLSAFVPMYILVLTKTVLDLINGNIELNITNVLVTIFLSIFVVLGFVGLFFINKGKSNIIHIKVEDVDNVTGQYFFGYFSLFVLLAVNFDLSKICEIVVFLLINTMIGVVYTHNNLYFINPLLNILGFDICNITYKSGGEDVCIKVFTNRKISIGDSISINTMFNSNFCKLM